MKDAYSQLNLLGIEGNSLIGLSGEAGVSLEYHPKSDVRMSPYSLHDSYVKSVSGLLGTIPAGYSVLFEAEVVNEAGTNKLADPSSLIHPVIKKIIEEKKSKFRSSSRTINYSAHIWKSSVDPLKSGMFPSILPKGKKQKSGLKAISENHLNIQEIGKSFQSSLSSVNVTGNILEDHSIKKYFWRRLSPSKSQYLDFIESPRFSLRSQLLMSNFQESKEHVFFDGHYHAFVSFLSYPDELLLGSVDTLLESLPLGTRYLVCVTVPDQESFIESLKSKHKRAGSLMAESKDKDFESNARYGDLDEIITRCRNEGERIYFAWAGVMLRHENELTLKAWKKDLLFSIREIIGGNGLDEDCIHKRCFLSTLPLNGHLNPRKYVFTGTTLSGLIPLSHPWKGTKNGTLIMSTRSSESLLLDIYDGGSPKHGIVVSSTGSGKSFTANVLIMGLLSDPNARIMVIDVGGSYRRITEIVDGSYYDIRIDEKYAINPMLPRSSILNEDGKIDAEVLASQTSLIARIVKISSGPGRLVLEKSIEKAYQNLEQPLLGDLYRILLSNNWDESLRPAVQSITNELMQYTEGVYSKIFSTHSKIRPFEKQLTVFDMAGLKDHKELQSALIGVIAFTLNQKLEDKKIRKLIVIDEGWELFADPAAADLISKLYRQARKQNAAIFSISQSPIEFLQSPVSTAIMANVHWVMALKMSTGHDKLLEFGFSDQAVDRARSLQMVPRSYSEVLIRFGDEPNRIARIIPTSFEYWIATTNADETYRESNQRITQNLSAIESIELMAKKEPVLP